MSKLSKIVSSAQIGWANPIEDIQKRKELPLFKGQRVASQKTKTKARKKNKMARKSRKQNRRG